MNKTTNAITGKKGFTLMEMVFVIIIIAGLMAIIIPKITTNSNKSEISATLGSDIKTILSKASEWKQTDSASDGTFDSISTDKLAPYLPTNMSYDSSSGCIKSSGYGGQVCYKIAPDKVTNNGDSVKIYVDMSKALGSAKIRKMAETIGMNILVNYSSEKDKSVKTPTATDIGNANSNFKTDGGAADDGKFGVRKITQ